MIEAINWTMPEDQRNEDNKKCNNFKDFIMQGIYSPKYEGIRTEFCDKIELICEKIHQPPEENIQKPRIFMINLLKENFPTEETVKLSGPFFELLVNLLK